MPKQEIVVTISESGDTTVEVHGVAGSACEQATAELEQAMGVVRTREHTAAYYQQPVVQRRHRHTS